MAHELRDVSFDDAEGMVDLTLHLDRVDGGDDSPWVLRAQGRLASERVGLEVVIATGMRPGIRKGARSADEMIDRTAFYPGGLVFRSLGDPTTRLGHALARAYGLPPSTVPFAAAVAFTAFALGGDPRRLQHERVDFKVFFDQAGPDLYSELYVNVDLAARTLELREKDEDYREPLIRALLPG